MAWHGGKAAMAIENIMRKMKKRNQHRRNGGNVKTAA